MRLEKLLSWQKQSMSLNSWVQSAGGSQMLLNHNEDYVVNALDLVYVDRV